MEGGGPWLADGHSGFTMTKSHCRCLGQKMWMNVEFVAMNKLSIPDHCLLVKSRLKICSWDGGPVTVGWSPGTQV